MRRLLAAFFDLLLLVGFVASLWGAYAAFQYYFPKGFPNGGLAAGVQRLAADVGTFLNYAQAKIDELRSTGIQETNNLGQKPTAEEFQLAHLAPRLKSIPFRTITVRELDSASVQINSCAHAFISKSQPIQTKVILGDMTVYILKNRALLEQENHNPCAETLAKTVLLFEHKKKLTGLVEPELLSRSEGIVSLAQLGKRGSQKTLIWSVHSGGANMKFEHFLFQFDRRGEATLNLTFADSISEQELNCIGLVDTNQERGAFCGTGRRSIAPSKERGGRGRFLTLPKRILTELEYETMYQQLNEKFSPLYFAQPAFARMHNSKEPVYALLQRDGSMLDRTPLDDERFIYEVIELDEQGWQDASDKPAAQAFYRAIANSLFRELSLVSGEARNWMLGSWASYKALLGEWDEAKEIVKEKTDEAAARRQLCTLREIIANLPQGSTVNDLKIAYVLRESRGQAKTAGAKCRPAPLVEFIEDELIGRGFLKPNPER